LLATAKDEVELFTWQLGYGSDKLPVVLDAIPAVSAGLAEVEELL